MAYLRDLLYNRRDYWVAIATNTRVSKYPLGKFRRDFHLSVANINK
jgi:hypothetical protein